MIFKEGATGTGSRNGSEKDGSHARNRSQGLFRIGAALAAALFLLGVPAVSEAIPPGPSQCMNKFSLSDASDSCQSMQVTVVGYNCQFSGECRDTEGDWQNTGITVSPEDATGLNNCNGVLTDGNC